MQVTYPLDTLRMRLALDPALCSVPRAVATLWREGGPAAFYRGLRPAMVGIAPYMALELATYDTLPENVPAFARGFAAALLASMACYPLDTVRRQIQIQSTGAVAIGSVVRSMYTKEGVLGFYRGFVSNALKNLPNKGAHQHADGPLVSCALALGDVARLHGRRTRTSSCWRRKRSSTRTLGRLL
jgi:solute carrier family 25 (mitochondrial phosphate transporter), member 23/24/25/41